MSRDVQSPKGGGRPPGGRKAPARGGRSGAARDASVPGVYEQWLHDLYFGLAAIKSVTRAWVFGSRAIGTHNDNSDLDIAVELKPDDGKILAEWIFGAKRWRAGLQECLGETVKLDLQLAWKEEDEVVWPAVCDHGIQFYQRSVIGGAGV